MLYNSDKHGVLCTLGCASNFLVRAKKVHGTDPGSCAPLYHLTKKRRWGRSSSGEEQSTSFTKFGNEAGNETSIAWVYVYRFWMVRYSTGLLFFCGYTITGRRHGMAWRGIGKDIFMRAFASSFYEP